MTQPIPTATANPNKTTATMFRMPPMTGTFDVFGPRFNTLATDETATASTTSAAATHNKLATLVSVITVGLYRCACC